MTSGFGQQGHRHPGLEGTSWVTKSMPCSRSAGVSQASSVLVAQLLLVESGPVSHGFPGQGHAPGTWGTETQEQGGDPQLHLL